MSRYNTPPFCSDEELLQELNKLGYDDVSPDVFNMMKDDLAELVEQEQVDPPLSEYDNDISPTSSKFLITSSDAVNECRTKQQTGKKNSSPKRKVKKKSPSKNSRTKKDRNSEKISESSRCQITASDTKLKGSNVSLDYEKIYDIPDEDALADVNVVENKYNSAEESKVTDNYSVLRSSKADINKNEDLKYKNSQAKKDRDSEKITKESSRCQNTVYEPKIKGSNVSLDYDIQDEDPLADIDDLVNKYNIDEPKSNSNYSALRTAKADINRNEDLKYKNVSRKYKSKESDFKLGCHTKNDRHTSNSDVSESKQKINLLKDSKYTSSLGTSYDQAYCLSSPRRTAIGNSLKTVKDYKLDKNSSESDEFMLNNYKGSDINLNISQSSTSSETKTMKRKVLRRRNGRSVITEELVEVPNIFDTSYPESENLSSSKSFSSDDLSFKSNSSTGSTTAVSPESIKSSPSTFSLLSTRSTSFRVANSRKKKSDPVAMYGYYRKFWDNFKPPGENTHDKIRWAVRDKMLEYNI